MLCCAVLRCSDRYLRRCLLLRRSNFPPDACAVRRSDVVIAPHDHGLSSSHHSSSVSLEPAHSHVPQVVSFSRGWVRYLVVSASVIYCAHANLHALHTYLPTAIVLR